ncbi:hypothetical protein L207DRAFT_583302 [Hyaloscypha variabilis F]|uniref:Uncharacterized protein n=1 Tax=Hyaloscypha variabilis (strain UAMH 11265 / GT02V1 / F) TaxID=1149755 RepID=A0A2J6RLQ0_HYAVF|nr:hypothetical protein L207DRAFT_583302 [Hyaloscypha variabilis F]
MDSNSDTALPGAVEVARLNQTASNEEMRSLRLVLDEIRQLRASQVDILALLQQKSDSKADLADPRKLSQSLAQNFNADVIDNIKQAVMEFWRDIFPTQENVSKSLERWISLVFRDPQFIKINPAPLYNCLLVTENGITSKLTSSKISSGNFRQRLESHWSKIPPPDIGVASGWSEGPSRFAYVQLHQATSNQSGLPLLRESELISDVGRTRGIEVQQGLS